MAQSPTNSADKKTVGAGMSVYGDPRQIVLSAPDPTGFMQGKLLLNPEKCLDLAPREKDARRSRRQYNRTNGGSVAPFYEKLLARQGNVCPLCRCDFAVGERLEAHHRTGEEMRLDNTVLLHSACHRAFHSLGHVWERLTRTWGRGYDQSRQARQFHKCMGTLAKRYEQRRRGGGYWRRSTHVAREIVARERAVYARRMREYWARRRLRAT